MIRDDLALLGIRHDVFFSERSLQTGDRRPRRGGDRSASRRGISSTRARCRRRRGRCRRTGRIASRRSSARPQFGDDVDRPLLKSDGSYTYFASDIAYHYDKYLRGFRAMIDVLGADHGGYVKRMKAAVTAMSGGEATLEVQLCQLVKLFRGGEPVQMSKRSGDLVTLREVVEEVGPDAVRFMMVFRKTDAPLDFDFQTVTEQSKDNPVFYVQYAHARTASVFRQAKEEVPEIDLDAASLAEADLSCCSTDAASARSSALMADWPRMVAMAARAPRAAPYRVLSLRSGECVPWPLEQGQGPAAIALYPQGCAPAYGRAPRFGGRFGFCAKVRTGTSRCRCARRDVLGSGCCGWCGQHYDTGERPSNG